MRGFWIAAAGMVAAAAAAAAAMLLAIGLSGRLQATLRVVRRVECVIGELDAKLGEASGRLDELEAGLGRRIEALGTGIAAAQGGLRSLGKAAETQTHALASLILYDAPASTRVARRGPPLVMISQAPRSGGTLLSQLFDGHPQLLTFPHELKWGEEVKHAWPKVEPADGPQRVAASLIAHNLVNLRRFNLQGYSKSPKLPPHHGLTHRWSYWRYIDVFCEEWQARAPASRRDCLDIFFAAYFSAFSGWRDADAAKAAMVAFTPGMSRVETHPDNVTFFSDYPDGLLICTCREPVGWFASASRHSPRYEDPEAALALWAESARSAIALKEAYDPQVVLLSFESLVERPRQVMAMLARRVGVSFHESLLSPTFNGIPIVSNSSFDARTGIDPEVLSRSARVRSRLRKRIEAAHLPVYRAFLERCDAL